MKICNYCGKEKDDSEFSLHRGIKDGLRPECKACYRLKYDIARKKTSRINNSVSGREYLPETKKCSKCSKIKSQSDFSLSKNRFDGLSIWCNDCLNIHKRAHKSHVMYRYGINEFQYNVLLESQDGKCAICGNEESRVCQGIVTPLCIDHNHKTHIIRGLLCHRCNSVLGFVGDDINLLRSLIRYLEKEDNNDD
jgi:hypothetical protein